MRRLTTTFEYSQLTKKASTLFLGLISLFTFVQKSYGQELHQCNKSHIKQVVRANEKDLNNKFSIEKIEAFWDVDMTNGGLEGRVIQWLNHTDSLKDFYLELSNRLGVEEVLINDLPVAYNHQGDRISFTQGIAPSVERNKIEVRYGGLPQNSENRSFEFRTHEGNPIIWTLSEPYGAKDWWPCVQLLNYKIDTTLIHVTFPKQYRSASNGLLTSRIENGDKATETWEHYKPINYYLIAIAVTNYEEYSYQVELSGGSMLFQNLIYSENSSLSKVNIDQTPKMLRFLDSLLTPYPYVSEKYGHAQWNWGGGMEHQTMSFMVNFSFDLVAHELAHQWFGDLVTCGSWRDVWLNEGFATYFNYICREFLSDPEVAKAQLNSLRNRSLDAVTGHVYAQDTLDVIQLFSNRLRYSKGAFVLHMLRNELGDSTFFAGIKQFLQSFSEVGFAKTSDFASIMEQASGRNLDRFFNQWIYGESYPVLHYSWDSSGNRNFLKINQFLKSTNAPSNFDVLLPVYLKGFEKDSLIYLRVDSPEKSFVIETDFPVDLIKLDPDQSLIVETVLGSAPFSSSSGQLILFPNPVKSNSTLISKSSSYLFEDVYVFDALGKKVIELHPENPGRHVDLNLDNIKPGQYYIQAVYRGNKKEISFIKQ